MWDFFICATRMKQKIMEIYPKFILKNSEDLMIRGGDFYAVWIEEQHIWSTDEQDVIRGVDRELDALKDKLAGNAECEIRVLHMWDSSSGMIDVWHKYCQKQMRDRFHMLDEKITFADTEVKKSDYVSKKLAYPLKECQTPCFEKMISTLYSPCERKKIEWAIGSVVTGDSVKIQKFMVFFGSGGTGKSTMLNIIHKLFEPYVSVFDAKALGSSSNSFALESFRSNPLVAIQQDGDLSRIEDNTRLNSLVSHEVMSVNEKFKSTYENRFNAFLFIGTNKPVKITDAKSGLIRRLIDVTPTGNTIPFMEYMRLKDGIAYELGGIACRCKRVYEENKNAYDDYIPLSMIGASNDFYNFILDSYDIFAGKDSTTLKAAWELYKKYAEDAKVNYPYSMRPFKEELKNYFREYSERYVLPSGERVRNYYQGFRGDKFMPEEKEESEDIGNGWLTLSENESEFDKECCECRAQYAGIDELPQLPWDDVNTYLGCLLTSKLHYVRVPENHIVIDFDMKTDGKKDLSKNIEEAQRLPPTYAEVSKSGQGLHLHYIYDGDPKELASQLKDNVEIKVFTGKSSLRRKLTLCNREPVRHISSGLPLRVKPASDMKIRTEKGLRRAVERNLRKEIHANTKPSVDFIKKILDDAYLSGMHYDIRNMKNDIFAFAQGSTNNSEYCVRLAEQMKMKSADVDDGGLVFFDTEVFPNLFVLNWKEEGNDEIHRMINPTSDEMENLMERKLVGFNNLKYDNHILYGRYVLGYDNAQLYQLSKDIISGKRATFPEAYSLSYTDVYDFSTEKMSLKKFEIALGIHHKELGLPWNEPVPENMWETVASYCDNDVRATEAVFNARSGDFRVRQMLADVAGMTVNDSTNRLTGRIIFGKNRTPQAAFNWRNMAEPVGAQGGDTYAGCRIFGRDGEPIGKDWVKGDVLPEGYSIVPYFPGYTFKNGISTYRGEMVGEGGYVYSEPGIYYNVVTEDVASMHPSSILAENLFGNTYTARFKDIYKARIAIKHKDFDSAKKMMGGKLEKYLTDEESAGMLAKALKIAINSVYGLTAAKFDNVFRDPRNPDNIVAKRGALFMVNLRHRVQDMGYTVAHIKTDSIKIPNADRKVIDFVVSYGKEYGYNFETEAIYEKMCLVNDAVYIAKTKDGKWTATGKQFAVPYVFKTLFSHEEIVFSDLCETFSVETALYLEDENNERQFVGRVGQFCPMKNGGRRLCRLGQDKDGNPKYDAATGSKGFLWMESEDVLARGLQDEIDMTYFEKMAEKAKRAISAFGDFDEFAK